MDEHLKLPKRKPGRPRIHPVPGTVRRKGYSRAVHQTSIGHRLKLNREYAQILENANYYGMPHSFYIQTIFLAYVRNVPYWDENKRLIYTPEPMPQDSDPFILDMSFHYVLYEELSRRVDALDTQRNFIIQDAIRQYIENGAWGADESEYMKYQIYEMVYKMVPNHKKTAFQAEIPTEIFMAIETQAIKAGRSFGKEVSDILQEYVLNKKGYGLVREPTKRQKQAQKLEDYLYGPPQD